MRSTWVATVGTFVGIGLAAWALLTLTPHMTGMRTDLASMEHRLGTRVGAVEARCDSRVAAVEKRLEAGIVLLPTLVDEASSVPLGGDADRRGIAPPVPPDASSARTPEAQLQLDEWVAEYCEARLALDRRDSLRRTADSLNGRSVWRQRLGEQAATEEIAARLAIKRAEQAKSRFGTANR
jgi:hypothetical protein